MTNAIKFPFPKLAGLITVCCLLLPFTTAALPAAGPEPTPTVDPSVLSEGMYTADDPSFTYSGADWKSVEGGMQTGVQHAMIMWQVRLKKSAVVVIEYRADQGGGHFQVQVDDEPAGEPVDTSAGAPGSRQYWVSPTLKPGLHSFYLTSQDDRPVTFSAVGIGPVFKAQDAAFDNETPGILTFGEWTREDYPMAANGGRADISGGNSGAKVVVFDQSFPGSVNVNLISTDQMGQVVAELDGLPAKVPYQTPGQPIAVSIILGKTEPGRHVLKVTGDGAENIVRFDGFKISEKKSASLVSPSMQMTKTALEETPSVTVEHPLPLIAGGKYHACLVSVEGQVQCSGYNVYGQLGRGPEGASLDILPMAPVHGLDNGVKYIAAGSNHTCALLTGGKIKCWGNNQFGQLGNGSTASSVNEPVDVTGLGGEAVDITAGQNHTCAILSDGRVQCWGSNKDGQLGNGKALEFLGRSKPVDVIGLTSPAHEITAGYNHTCARLEDGSVWCWGNNTTGQLGDGTIITGSSIKGKSTPVQVNSVNNAAAISAGGNHTCAIIKGSVSCWGENTEGQLGNGTFETSPSAVQVTGLNPGVFALASGENHTCALSPDRDTATKGIQCWGGNDHSQLGDPAVQASSAVPVDVPGYTGEKKMVTAGAGYTCILSTDGQVYCWGITSYGQPGVDTGLMPLPAETTTAPSAPEATQTPSAVTNILESPVKMEPDLAVPGDETLQRGNAWVEAVTVNAGTLVVEGNMPTPCHQVRVNVPAAAAGGRIAVEVYTLSDPQAICAQELTPFSVKVTLPELTIGEYTLEINGNAMLTFLQPASRGG